MFLNGVPPSSFLSYFTVMEMFIPALSFFQDSMFTAFSLHASPSLFSPPLFFCSGFLLSARGDICLSTGS